MSWYTVAILLDFCNARYAVIQHPFFQFFWHYALCFYHHFFAGKISTALARIYILGFRYSHSLLIVCKYDIKVWQLRNKMFCF